MLGELIHSVLVFLEGLGYWGIMLGLMLEVIPSEIVLSYAGYLVSTGSITFWGAVAFGTIGGVIAQLFIYWCSKHKDFSTKTGTTQAFIHGMAAGLMPVAPLWWQ